MPRTGAICVSMVATVAALAFAAPASATTSTPTEESVGFNLTPPACRTIALPVNNRPIHVMGTQITTAYASGGVGQVTLVRSTGNGGSLMWAGVDLVAGVERGSVPFSGNATLIMYLDNVGSLVLFTAPSGRVQLCNYGGNPTVYATGFVTFVY